MKDFYGKEYSIPADLVERFEYVNYKLNLAKVEDHDELFLAYNVVLKSEFGKFKVKSTRSWFKIFTKKKNEHIRNSMS